MDRLTFKFEIMQKALDTLKEAIEAFNLAKTTKNTGDFDPEVLFKGLRDSLIQRLEYCVDLHWKYINFYMKHVSKTYPQENTSADVIRTATNARLLSEQEAEIILLMIDERNRTSHIYKQEIATQFVASAQTYYDLMSKITNRLLTKKSVF